ncbi:Crp/Fnr family transcriptional regulator [Caenispirillum bisanense]|uniref:Crp/Fnr family transcriptional regulator n=1 Tax=Caenispirillum bisanense TaxID=414052 RepID=UPI0031D49D8A
MAENRPLVAADLRALSQAPLFAQLGPAELEAVAATGSVRRYDHGALLFSAGDEADAFYAVAEGAVHLFALTPEGDQSLVTIIGSGESFAEAALFGAGRFPVNAEVQGGTTLIRIDGRLFLKALRDNKTLGFHMLDSLLARQVFLIHEIHHLKAHSPSQRLASYLLSLIESDAWNGRGRLPLRKQLVASRIGIEPESLSRALRRLDEAGVVCAGDHVVVEDEALLRAYCASFGEADLLR